MKKVLAILFVLAVFQPRVWAQGNGSVNGFVKDEGSTALPAATVSLLKALDSALVKVAVTDKNGQYLFSNLDSGKYLISITSVGFETHYSNIVDVKKDSEVSLPAVTLLATKNTMGGVTVQARRPLIENKIDKMVVNVDASPTNAGNTALEVLEKSPGISVDRDGNISLKGKQGVIVLMDGKQTYLSGQDLANLLRNMPASQLDQIEILTQPSSKYDAAGNAGIINLKIKKSKQVGFNGSISLGYVQGNYPKSPNSFTFNYRKNKFNLFSNLSYSYWESNSRQNLYRKFLDKEGTETSVFDQTSNQKFTSNYYNARVGMDYSIDKKTTLGFLVNGTYNNRSVGLISVADIYNASKEVDSTNLATSNSADPWKNLTTNLNFRRLLDAAGRELTADLDFIRYSSTSTQNTDNYIYYPGNVVGNNPYLLRGVLPSDINIYSAKVDYIHPLKKGAKLEAGAKRSLVQTDNNAPYQHYDKTSGTWVDDARKDHFAYNETINAVYLNYSRKLKKWGVQTGLRYEQTASTGKQVLKNRKITNRYQQLFPTAYVSYAMNEKNNFALSYGRRIERPNYQDLNPFQRFLDQYTYNQGNPYLMPQFTNNIELSHNYKGALNTTFNYTATTDIINDILKQNDTTRVTFQTKENVAKRQSVGLAVSYNAPITKWWTTSLYVNAFNNHYEGLVNGQMLDENVASFMANMSQQFKLKKGWGTEVSGFYRSRTLETGMFLIDPMYVLSFGASKQILKAKGSLKLNITDPFALQKATVYVKFGNIDMVVKNRWDNRRVGLTFTYRFSKGKVGGQQRRRTGSASEEQSRIGQNSQ